MRKLREGRGLTQEQAAAAAKLDPKHWQAIEAGETNPTVASLAGLARALNAKLADIVEGI